MPTAAGDRPYYEAGPEYAPWARGWYAGSGAYMMSNVLIGHDAVQRALPAPGVRLLRRGRRGWRRRRGRRRGCRGRGRRRGWRRRWRRRPEAASTGGGASTGEGSTSAGSEPVRTPAGISGWPRGSLLRGSVQHLRLGHPHRDDHREDQQPKGDDERPGERPVRRPQGGHHVDEHHRALAEQLHQSVRRALGRRARHLGGVLEPDRQRRDQEEAEHQAREQERGQGARPGSPRPIRGWPRRRPATRNRRRRPCRSDRAGSTTAPTRPPRSRTAPSVPASAGENPRGRSIASTHVVSPLKTPRPMKAIASTYQNAGTRSRMRQPVEHEGTFLLARWAGRRRRVLPGEAEEQHRAERGGDPVRELDLPDRHRLDERRTQDHARGCPHEVADRHHTDRRRPLARTRTSARASSSRR